MNTQERELLSQMLKQLVDFKLNAKDPEAEALIREAASHQPDAVYLLVQRVLLQEHALNNAKAKIEELQRQVQNTPAGQAGGSFLGSDPWTQPAAASGQVPGAGNYQMPRPAPQAAAQPQSGGGLFGGGSFLGNVATTAAGVAAGSFLFQGIENLMGHHGGGFGSAGFDQNGFGQSGFGQGGFGGEPIIEETVINNNYYGDAPQLADNDDYGNAGFLSDDDDFADDSSDSDWI